MSREAEGCVERDSKGDEDVATPFRAIDRDRRFHPRFSGYSLAIATGFGFRDFTTPPGISWVITNATGRPMGSRG